jgi:acyl-CoA synthetase (AMP-forming)/AMP-acid ligase II
MTETSPLGTVSRLQPQHFDLPQEEQLTIRAKQGIAFPGVEIRIMTDEGTLLHLTVKPWANCKLEVLGSSIRISKPIIKKIYHRWLV